jgi:hypothetical protein
MLAIFRVGSIVLSGLMLSPGASLSIRYRPKPEEDFAATMRRSAV